MKKEFSFYEFVGLIVPSVSLLYIGQLIWIDSGHQSIIDFTKIGDSACFFIICYGIGHLIQGIGNHFETLLWWCYGGMPTKWLINKNRFGNYLFEKTYTQKQIDKLTNQFGNMNDYGLKAYNFLVISGAKTDRIDIFNSNYSLFRGLSITTMILFVDTWYAFSWKIAIIPFVVFIIFLLRMIRFAKHYAKEIYRSFDNLKLN